MVGQFGVQTPDREPIAALDADEFSRALEIWNAHWTAVDELMTESRRRRSARSVPSPPTICATPCRCSARCARASTRAPTTSFNSKCKNGSRARVSCSTAPSDMRMLRRVAPACSSRASTKPTALISAPMKKNGC